MAKPHKLHTPHIGQAARIRWDLDGAINGVITHISKTWFDVYVAVNDCTYTFKRSSLRDIDNCAGTVELLDRDRIAESLHKNEIARS